jgi:HD superfamily phosphohydrolase
MSRRAENRSDGVDPVFDALHGNIQLSDLDDGNAHLQRIVSAPFVQRLRRIKQLGFVSQNFLSAQHNRYSHALGTIEMMRRLIARLDGDASVFEQALPGIKQLTGDRTFNRGTPDERRRAVDHVKQHLLVAGAIQDVGELPYERATARVFSPGQAIRGTLRNAAVDLSQIKNKDLFTLYFVWDANYSKEYFDGLNKSFLTFLISGLVPAGQSATKEMLALRQMVDGAIDADRLDYVYRDALHTIGIHHTPDALINSITGYNEVGPALSHVRPVTDFIVTRAMLWSNVYLSPENRFRIILLRMALRKLSDKPFAVEQFIGWKPDEVTPDNFLDLDDLFIEKIIQDVHERKPDLDTEARQAVALLQEGAPDYEYRWVRFADETDKAWHGPIDLPLGFYWDTYADFRERRHTLYDRGSVRIVGDRYTLLSDEVHLEECIGPFCSLLQSGTWPALPMDNHMAWFAPRSVWDNVEGLWSPLVKFQKARELTLQLQFNDPLQGATFIADTRNFEGFRAPSIFLAFAWEDKEFVERLAGVLTDLRRRYFVLLDDTKGLGRSPVGNSQKAVDDAGAVILLASKEYVRIYGSEPNGAIHGEVSRMEARKDQIPIVAVCLDRYDDIKEGFPWTLIGSEARMPFVGGQLRDASSERFRTTIIEVIAFIDAFKAR